MTDLSIIIVSYNVAFFLELCLKSVENAKQNLNIEVFVVDNNSRDESVETVKSNFPFVNLIENKSNLGFSKANNQAIIQAKGKYILILNPDTVVSEDTFVKCFEFMENNKNAGGLGVKMVDGSGNFAPESKRAIPTPKVSLYKVLGLRKLFPNKTKYNQYYLSQLPENEINETGAISGAFMWVRNELMQEIGGFDEDYFMYGEDIDLSYKIIQKGYKNFYFPNTQIIHFKGESTKKHSIKYIFTFHRSLDLFYRKNLAKNNSIFIRWLINIAIYFKASLTLIKNKITRLHLMLIDFLVIFGSLETVKLIYENLTENTSKYLYPHFFLFLISIILVLFIRVAYGYQKPYKLSAIAKGTAFGFVFTLIVYSLLSEDYRFSRAVIVFGITAGILCLFLVRYLLNRLAPSQYPLKHHQLRSIVVGNHQEYLRIKNIFKSNKKINIQGFIWDENKSLGSLNQIDEICHAYHINQIIFSIKDLGQNKILNLIQSLSVKGINCMLAPENSNFVIGSNDSSQTGGYFNHAPNPVNSSESKFNKRLFDFGMSLILIITFPMVIWFIKNEKKQFIKHLFTTLFGKTTWVGYPQNHNYPIVKEYLIEVGNDTLTEIERSKVIKRYSYNYSIMYDFNIILNYLFSNDK